MQKFWDICKPLGFYPIISKPDLSINECWHFDFPGKELEKAYKNISNSEFAKICILDIGKWDTNEDAEKVKKMFIQSQLLRLGFWGVGTIDGIFGNKTLDILKKIGMDKLSIDDCVDRIKTF